MVEQTPEVQLAALSPEERVRVETAAQSATAQQDALAFAESALYDARQDGKLNDPRDLGPTGGSV